MKDIVPGPASSDPRSFVTAGGLVFFKALDGAGASHLWRSDGTEAGTFLLKAVTASIEPPVAIGGTVFFAGLDGGLELWRTDGTPEGTLLVKDLSTSIGGGSPTNLTAVGAGALFRRGRRRRERTRAVAQRRDRGRHVPGQGHLSGLEQLEP